jgi:hypothetical protein
MNIIQEEDEKILVKDLYGRLLYDVECKDIYINVSGRLDEISTRYNMCRLSDVYGKLETCYIPNCRPYLFPMSSMTEEQRNEYDTICAMSGFDMSELDADKLITFFHENHIDYRGLIEKGLAIDATNLNIYEL